MWQLSTSVVPAGIKDFVVVLRKLRLAIHLLLIDKNEAGQKALFAYGWENVELTVPELAASVSKGIAYTAQLAGRRKAANFLASDIVSVDIDRGMTIEQALAHPLVARHAGLIYTTASHTPDAHRFRIVFPTPRTITDAREMRAVARSLALRLSGDPAAVDATRISFGARQAQTWLLGGELSVELLNELIAQSINPPESDRANGGVLVGVCSALALNPTQSIRLAGGMALPFSKVPGKTVVYCPFHADENASAFVVTSQRGVNGLHCAACACTYWPADGEDDVDFLNFDRVVRQAREHFEQHKDYGPLGQFLNSTAAQIGLLGCNIAITDREPAPPKLLRGLTLVKAPKGAGKTESLKRLIADARKVLPHRSPALADPAKLQAAGPGLLPR